MNDLTWYGNPVERKVGFAERAGNILSDAVSVVFPGLALKMDYARHTRNHLRTARTELMGRGYDGGKTNRFNKNKVVTDGNANQELLQANALINIRKFSRDLCRNSPIGKSIKKALIAHIVGRGYTLQANAKSPDGKPLPEENEKIERGWKIWSKKKNCDIRGKKSFNQFTRQAVGQYLETGEYIVNKVSKFRTGNPLSFKLEAIESDLLNAAYNNENERIIGGIKLDDGGMPIEYNILINSKSLFGNPTPMNHRQIPAENIIHSYIEDRPNQLRGEPWLAPAIIFLQTAHRTVEAELYATEVQACLTAIYSSKSGFKGKMAGSEDPNPNADGNRIRKIAPGLIAEIPGLDKFNVVEPQRPGNTFTPFIDFIIKLISASVDLSYQKVAKDYSKGSFSSLRMGDQDDRRHLNPIQSIIVDDIVKEVYDEFLDESVLRGLVRMPNYANNKDNYQLATFTPQPYKYIDPLKDSAADRESLKSGRRTHKQYLDEEGVDWKDHFDQLAAEQKYAKDNGIELEMYGGGVSQVNGDMRSQLVSAIMETGGEDA